MEFQTEKCIQISEILSIWQCHPFRIRTIWLTASVRGCLKRESSFILRQSQHYSLVCFYSEKNVIVDIATHWVSQQRSTVLKITKSATLYSQCGGQVTVVQRAIKEMSLGLEEGSPHT